MHPLFWYFWSSFICLLECVICLFIVNYVNFYVNVHCEIPMFLCGRFHRSSCPISSSLCPLGWGLEVCGPSDANQQHIQFIWGESVLGTRSRMCYKLQFSACLSRIHPGALVQVQIFFIYVPFIFYYRATTATNNITVGWVCVCAPPNNAIFMVNIPTRRLLTPFVWGPAGP